MTNNSLQKICELFYGAQDYPVCCFGADGTLLESFCTYVSFDRVFTAQYQKLADTTETTALLPDGTCLYGAIRIKKSAQTVLIGPFLLQPPDNAECDRLIRAASLPWEEKDRLAQFLSGLPQASFHRFLNLLSLFHYMLNGEDLSVTEIFRVTGERYNRSVGEKQTDAIWTEEQRFHGTYAFERQMLALVKAGDTEGLQALFERVAKQSFSEGKLADDSLRQQKNLFIGLIAMVGKDGAIEGNLDVEQTYQLIDLYTQECEKCRTVDEVNVLRYNAIMDFTQRVAELRHPRSLSNEVYTALQFIKTHTNQPIGVPDVVACVQRSRSAFLKQFKQETGTTVGKAIMDAKLQEAKLLLRYSDKSLAEISSFLYFSGQPYFQNMFKKAFGVTPLEYRRKKQNK